MVESLADDFLSMLRTEFADDTIDAAALSGSYARGTADAYSDVDLVLYSHAPLAHAVRRERLAYRRDQLVSIDVQTFEDRHANLRSPSGAIMAVMPLRRAMPLLDRDGSFATLQRAAREFTWEPLQDEADRHASHKVEGMAEVAHKVLGGLSTENAEVITLYTWELVLELTTAIAMHRRVLFDSGRTLFPQIQEAVGHDSAWTRQLRRAAGLETEETGLQPIVARGRSALGLYRETGALLKPVLTPEDAKVVEGAVARIDTAAVARP